MYEKIEKILKQNLKQDRVSKILWSAEHTEAGTRLYLSHGCTSGDAKSIVADLEQEGYKVRQEFGLMVIFVENK